MLRKVLPSSTDEIGGTLRGKGRTRRFNAIKLRADTQEPNIHVFRGCKGELACSPPWLNLMALTLRLHYIL
jgi:hypothetical protein